MKLIFPLRNSPMRLALFACLLLTATACGKMNVNPGLADGDATCNVNGQLADSDILGKSLFDRELAEKTAGGKSFTGSGDKLLSKNLFTFDTKNGPLSDRLLKTAFTQLGRYYRAGGNAPTTGFDCSGFTCWVFANNGIDLGRSSRDQYLQGKVVTKGELKKGDLVFFRGKREINHVGIYLEDGKFIHSASAGSTVKISSLSEPVWEKRYAGARRIIN